MYRNGYIPPARSGSGSNSIPIAPYRAPRPISTPALHGSGPSDRVELDGFYGQRPPEHRHHSPRRNDGGYYNRYGAPPPKPPASRPPSVWGGNSASSSRGSLDMDCDRYDARAESYSARSRATPTGSRISGIDTQSYRQKVVQNSLGGRRTDDERESTKRAKEEYEAKAGDVYNNEKRHRQELRERKRKQKESQLDMQVEDQAREKERAAKKLAALRQGTAASEVKKRRADFVQIDEDDEDEAVFGVPSGSTSTLNRAILSESKASNYSASDAEDTTYSKSVLKKDSSKKPRRPDVSPQQNETLDLTSPQSEQSTLRSSSKGKQRAKLDASPSSSPVNRFSSKLKKKTSKQYDSTPAIEAMHLLPASPSSSPPKSRFDLTTMLAQAEAEEEEELELLKEQRANKKRKAAVKRLIELTDSEDEEDDILAIRNALRERASPDPLLEGEEDAPDPTTLCPFCSMLLPLSPSKQLVSLKKYLLGRPNITPHPTKRNPLGKRLPVIETASFCRRHRWETTVIPEGRVRGWPTEIDWNALPRRVNRDLSNHLSEVILGRRSSPFLVAAKEEWQQKGRGMKNILSEFKSAEIELPGYFGMIGQERMTQVLNKAFVIEMPLLTTHSAAPLDIPAYIRRVLVPETAVELIRRDLELDVHDPDTRVEAEKICRESREYGQAMFSTTKEEEKQMRDEERRERKLARDQEEKRQEQQRLAKEKTERKSRMRKIAATAKKNAERLRRGEDVDLGDTGSSSAAEAAANGKTSTGMSDGTERPKRVPRVAVERSSGRSSGNNDHAEPARRRPRASLARDSDTDPPALVTTPRRASASSPPKKSLKNYAKGSALDTKKGKGKGKARASADASVMVLESDSESAESSDYINSN